MHDDFEKDPDYAALAKMATDRAVAELFTAGIPVVYLKGDRLVRRFPDGVEETVTDAEIREASGGALP